MPMIKKEVLFFLTYCYLINYETDWTVRGKIRKGLKCLRFYEMRKGVEK